ncbi:dihydrofolate reductase family protein [Georgenia sp. AZ-5]|uniref:dihydrofolate reductase family protein n=1 Tax=Georgenia sp. AZ-5 TaxID=3367526 RepID=UPI003754F0D5
MRPASYAEMFPPEDDSYRPTAVARTLFTDELDEPLADEVVAALEASDAPLRVAQLRVLGGAVAEVPDDATAYAHRRAPIMANVAAFYDGPADMGPKAAWVDALAARLDRTGAAYVHRDPTRQPGARCYVRPGRLDTATAPAAPGALAASRRPRCTGGDSAKEQPMRKVVVVNHVSLDGVMQAPASPDEDRRGGFDRGGWAMANADQVMGEAMGRGVAEGGELLLGRRTYESMAGYWPTAPPDDPYTAVMNEFPKHVASTTLREPLPWRNSSLLPGDAVDAVARLKAAEGKDLVVLGSGELVQSLMRRRLVDEFLLLVHPLVLGSGRRLFPDGGAPADLRLAGATTTTTGVIIATYRLAPAEPATEP